MPYPQYCRIYKITNTSDKLVYVGSTVGSLKGRMRMHKDSLKEGSEATIHKYMRSYGLEKFTIVLLARIHVETRREKLEHEQEWMDKYKTNLNDRRAYTSPEMKLAIARKYKADRPEKMKADWKRYSEDNREALEEKWANYRKENAQILRDKANTHYHKKKAEIKEKKRLQRQAAREARDFVCENCDHAFGTNQELKRHGPKCR